ncbi:MAG: hypothetical protein M3275_03180 [Thermoproteota archaeon]|nr:hypothetical protein [Thermoproteota archaeon]
MMKRMLKKVVRGLAQQYGIGGRQQCELYCNAEAYVVVEGDTRMCHQCFGRLGSLFKPSDVKLMTV